MIDRIERESHTPEVYRAMKRLERERQERERQEREAERSRRAAFIERQQELQRTEAERSRAAAAETSKEVNPCTRNGRYKCSKCNGQEDPITANEIENGICADKQCYEFGDLLQSLEVRKEVPVSKIPMTIESLIALQDRDDEC